MSRPLFTVVIPTIGRPTLARTLESIRAQSRYSDAEIIIVADTHGPLQSDVRPLLTDDRIRYWEWDAGQHDTGSPQLHLGFGLAEGIYVLNFGDDDVYEPHAFKMIAAIIAEQQHHTPLMFKVELHPNDQRGNRGPVVLWQDRAIERFGVTGQSFVCPNDPRRMGRWVDDITFMRETVALHGGRIEWREELIARCY